MSVPTQGETRIIIEFSGEKGETQGNATPSPASPAPVENTSKNPVDGDKNSQVKLSMALTTAKNIGVQGLNAAVSCIGLATGNTYAQAKVERAMSGAQTLVGLAASFTNPYTAIAAVAGLGIQAAAEKYQQDRERDISNYQSAQYAKRLGYTRSRR